MKVHKVWLHLRKHADFARNVNAAVAFRGSHFTYYNNGAVLYGIDMVQLANGKKVEQPDCKTLTVPFDNVASIAEVEWEQHESSD